MESLIDRAKAQNVINQMDFDRITAKMGAGEFEGFRSQVTVIDSISGVNIASLFGKDETFLDRGVLQGAINSKDYGALSAEEKQGVIVRNIKIDDALPSVNVFGKEKMLRSEFDSLNNAGKQDALSKVELVDTMPEPDLTRAEIHDITLRVSQSTKDQYNGSQD